MGKKTADGTVKIVEALSHTKKWLSDIIKSMDVWFYKLGRKQGVNRATSKTLGGAVRWAGVPYVVHSAFGKNQVPTNSTFVIQDYEVKPGSYSKSFE